MTGSIAAVCASDPPEGVRLLQGDFVTWPFQPGSFDAFPPSLHHPTVEADKPRPSAEAKASRSGGCLSASTSRWCREALSPRRTIPVGTAR